MSTTCPYHDPRKEWTYDFVRKVHDTKTLAPSLKTTTVDGRKVLLDRWLPVNRHDLYKDGRNTTKGLLPKANPQLVLLPSDMEYDSRLTPLAEQWLEDNVDCLQQKPEVIVKLMIHDIDPTTNHPKCLGQWIVIKARARLLRILPPLLRSFVNAQRLDAVEEEVEDLKENAADKTLVQALANDVEWLKSRYKPQSILRASSYQQQPQPEEDRRVRVSSTTNAVSVFNIPTSGADSATNMSHCVEFDKLTIGILPWPSPSRIGVLLKEEDESIVHPLGETLDIGVPMSDPRFPTIALADWKVTDDGVISAAVVLSLRKLLCDPPVVVSGPIPAELFWREVARMEYNYEEQDGSETPLQRFIFRQWTKVSLGHVSHGTIIRTRLQRTALLLGPSASDK